MKPGDVERLNTLIWRSLNRLRCSDTTPPPSSRSRLGALTEESETAHKLFDSARLPPELSEAASGGGGGAGAGPAGAASEGAAVDALESSALGRVFSAIGNTLFFGSVAAASFFGYYTYRYDVDQVGAGCWLMHAWAAIAGWAGGRGCARAACMCPRCSTLSRYFCLLFAPVAHRQVDRMVSETEAKPENAFAGSSVRLPARQAAAHGRRLGLMPMICSGRSSGQTPACLLPPILPSAAQVWVPVMRWYAQQRRHLEGEMKKYADPPSDRLLPDLPPNARHIKTLVLDLDDVLVHSDWTRGRWGAAPLARPLRLAAQGRVPAQSMCNACGAAVRCALSSGCCFAGSACALCGCPGLWFGEQAGAHHRPGAAPQPPTTAGARCAAAAAAQGLAHLQATRRGGLHPQHGTVLRAGGVHQPAAHVCRSHPGPARPAAPHPVPVRGAEGAARHARCASACRRRRVRHRGLGCVARDRGSWRYRGCLHRCPAWLRYGCTSGQMASPRGLKQASRPAVSLLSRLYRDSTQYVGGKHVRDLSKLNRDMRQVRAAAAGPAGRCAHWRGVCPPAEQPSSRGVPPSCRLGPGQPSFAGTACPTQCTCRSCSSPPTVMPTRCSRRMRSRLGRPLCCLLPALPPAPLPYAAAPDARGPGPDATGCAPRCLQLSKQWREGDTLLLDLMPFLEAVVRTHVRPDWVPGSGSQRRVPCAASTRCCWRLALSTAS